ncbi:MAG: 4-hydroxy-3-methylbut-2-enyl diphosphate reductase [Chloroflexia bacterium]|nr:4-hydroxy-3-methylbut-2-enyl diphosphate reductase [Chloroflexia bacterium]
MEIILAKEMGFCRGVRRALDMVQQAAQSGQQVRTLGDLVHNPQVVERLQSLGVQVVRDLEEVQAGQLAVVTAHGAPPAVFEQAQARDIALLDATCPLVEQVQKLAREMAQAGYGIVVCGDPGHVEVRGILGYAGTGAVAGRTLAEARSCAQQQELPLPWIEQRRLALLFQTTQREQVYRAFVSELVDEALAQLRELRVLNTVCAAVSQREPAARELAQRVDVVVVVGGKHSANTRHLAESCSAVGVPTYHIEQAEELEAEWFTGVQQVGVTAGTSTPDETVEAVIERLRVLGRI